MPSSDAYAAHARPKPNTFYPPTPNRLVIGLVQRNIRGAIWRKLKVTDVEITDADMARLRELTGQRRVWGPRKVIVQVGEPFDLRDRYESYRHDKRETVQQITRAIENEVRRMLTELGAKHETPMETTVGLATANPAKP